jgi:hypothetical protein
MGGREGEDGTGDHIISCPCLDSNLGQSSLYRVAVRTELFRLPKELPCHEESKDDGDVEEMFKE